MLMMFERAPKCIQGFGGFGRKTNVHPDIASVGFVHVILMTGARATSHSVACLTIYTWKPFVIAQSFIALHINSSPVIALSLRLAAWSVVSMPTEVSAGLCFLVGKGFFIIILSAGKLVIALSPRLAAWSMVSTPTWISACNLWVFRVLSFRVGHFYQVGPVLELFLAYFTASIFLCKNGTTRIAVYWLTFNPLIALSLRLAAWSLVSTPTEVSAGLYMMVSNRFIIFIFNAGNLVIALSPRLAAWSMVSTPTWISAFFLCVLMVSGCRANRFYLFNSVLVRKINQIVNTASMIGQSVKMWGATCP